MEDITLIYNNSYTALYNLITQGIQVDAIITDPPYNINQAEWDNDFDLSEIIPLCKQILKFDGNLIIFQGWSNVCETKRLLDQYFTCQDWIIYDRIKGRGGKKHLVSTREDILWYSNSDSYTFNKIPSTIKKKTGGLGLKNGCEFRALSNVWTDISPIVPWSKERVNHPTQKPVQLMKRCVELWTNEGDLVLDFTMGSGSTGVACKELGRRFIGIDNDEKYVNIAKERLGVE